MKRQPMPIRKGAALRCPQPGCPNNLRPYTTPIGLLSAECNATHATKQMKVVK